MRRHVVHVAPAVRRGQHGVGRRGQHRVVVGPVVAAGVVEPHAHAPGPHRLAQVAHQVAARPVLALDRVRHGRGPQREAVVVLGGEHDVARARRPAQVGQGVEVGARRGVVEGADEVVVGVVLAVDLGVVELGRAALDLHGVAVPLGVRVLAQHPLRPVLDQQLLNVGHPRRPARHRVEAPVDEDPELGVVEPDGHPVRPQGLPRPLEHGGHGGSSGARARADAPPDIAALVLFASPHQPLSPRPEPLPPAPAACHCLRRRPPHPHRARRAPRASRSAAGRRSRRRARPEWAASTK